MKVKDKATGEVVEANRVADPDFEQRQAGVAQFDWQITHGDGTVTYATPQSFVDHYEVQS